MRMQKLKMRQILAVLAAIVLLADILPQKAVADEIEAPAFHAYIDFDGQGYTVMGEATFPADTCRVQNLYSLDGIHYEVYHREWVMPGPITGSVASGSAISGSAIQVPQICLQANDAPLRNYLDGTLDRFYLKLLITREDGTTYESEAALIERNREPQLIP